MAAGGTGAALLMALMATFTADTSPVVLHALLYLLGVCVGHLVMSAQNTAFATIPPARTGDATTVLNVQRQGAAAFGTALVGTLLGALGTTTRAGAVGTAAYHAGFLTLAALTLCAAALALRISDRRVRAALNAADAHAARGEGAPSGPAKRG
ncbi:hypothetical protein QQY24_08220 [Streptomyces sp. TG1A-8]|nr:hypothetical protein [Streptomyces sp. TG1A-8]MDO0925405.1 hypothetical protein [Streptomyces sp. TG1A-8]